MAITKLHKNALPDPLDLTSVDLQIGNDEIVTANIADTNVTHAKLHTDMDLSGKTVTLPTLSSLDISGNVGIGATSPNSKLTVSAGSGGTILELNRSNTNTTGTVGAISFTASDGHVVSAINVVGDGDNEGGDIQFRTTSNASGTNYYNDTDVKMTIQSDGNVGIGADPSSYSSYKTVIRRDDATAWPSPSTGGSSGEAVLALINNSTSSFAYSNLVLRAGTGDCGIAAVYQNAANNSDLVFYTDAGSNGSEQMRLTHEGNVGIGTTSPSFATIDTYSQRGIEISGSKETGTAPVIKLTETGSGKGAFEIRSNRQGVTSGNYLAFGENTDTFMVIRGDDDSGGTARRGNVGIGTTGPTHKLHVAGVIRSEGYNTDSIASYNITGSYTAGTEYVFTTRNDIQALGYGGGFYKFLVWSDTFHAGTSHYQCYTPYDEFYFNNYSSNASGAQAINYGVSMGHAPNTFTRAIDIKLRHKYGVDATYPANQTFTFIPVNGFTNLNGAAGYGLRIYLFKVA